MSEKIDGKIIFYRTKADEIGAIVVGCLLLLIAIPALTLDSIGSIRFSKDLVVMSTYLGAPLGVVLILANIRHVMAKGPTMAGDGKGITLLFTDPPAGPLHWAEIKGFLIFRHQGKQHLGITFENPELSLTPFKKSLSPLVRRKGPNAAHLKIEGRMLGDNMKKVIADLEEMHAIYSWRAR
jgi:hypothetical protein